MAPDPPPAEVLPWLKTLPLAPEYHPTLAEFQDPIAYILKIEKEASQFGICKIVPPLPAAPKKAALANLNRSFAARSDDKSPTFTTRQQQIGFCPRRSRPVQKPVWQSGEQYTLLQFEAKAKQFEKTQLKKAGKKSLLPLETESLFWRACVDKPFSVEYANDMPGSGFVPLGGAGKKRWEEEAGNVGESAWNMRGVSRAKGSLLRFMKEDIPGVTSPMVYVAMMFSWFAWHVEDHELHSMNYLHMGSGKTWYGVPRDAGLAFEDVVRVHGYNGEANPLMTFAILGEKTTIISPEVFIGAGIPCCRLVQNAGEFVVTFPGAYHSGFSHGFNCGEAANIATPEWLKVAKEAAVKRASTNYPPMVSHFQLLYALALSFCSRMPMSCCPEPRSSRLKYKMKGEGEAMVKDIFVENVIQNNNLISILLEKGSSCIVLPQNTSHSPLYSGPLARSQIKVKPRLSLGLCSHQEAVEAVEVLFSNDVMLERNGGIGPLDGFCPMEGNSVALCQEKKLVSEKCSKFAAANLYPSTSDMENVEGEKEHTRQGDGLLDKGLLSCVTCGILSFACVAVIQPREATARYLMSADCSIFNDQIVDSGETSDLCNVSNGKIHNGDMVSVSGVHVQDRLDENLIHSNTPSVEDSDKSVELVSDSATQKCNSALDLLASAYWDSSDSEEEALHDTSVRADENDLKSPSLTFHPDQKLPCAISSPNICSSKVPSDEIVLHSVGVDCQNGATGISKISSKLVSDTPELAQTTSLFDVAANLQGLSTSFTEEKYQIKMEFSAVNWSGNPGNVVTNNLHGDRKTGTSRSLTKCTGDRHSTDLREIDSRCLSTEIVNICHSDMKMANPLSGSTNFNSRPDSCCDLAPSTGNADMKEHLSSFGTSVKKSSISVMQRSDKDSSRMHVFCLEHALDVERQLHPIGGVHIMLLCHPEYPKIEAEAKLLADELGVNHLWKDIPYREANKEDQERIRSALEDEEAIPMNSDWAVKLGINLYYSALLSKTPLYSKQLPYNAVIYKAFGYSSAGSSPVKPNAPGRRSGRQRKMVVAGRWCGKVWMSNQVHPYLAHRKDDQERVDRLHGEDNDQKPIVESDDGHADSVSSPKRNTVGNNSASTRKSGKKRKKPLRKSSSKKPRCAESNSVEDVAEDSSAQGGRVLRSSLNKHTAASSRNEISNRHKLNSKDEVEEPSLRHGRQKSKSEEVKVKSRPGKQIMNNKAKKAQATSHVTKDEEAEYPCDMEGCTMSFSTKQDLVLHKRNICPAKGCGKKFFSHKYLVQHRKVHMDDRPLKCPWKGCKMTFKWPWARTEHIRVHTGDRPYVCREAGCGQTFRFVSDFSRHKRKTGHSAKKVRR